MFASTSEQPRPTRLSADRGGRALTGPRWSVGVFHARECARKAFLGRFLSFIAPTIMPRRKLQVKREKSGRAEGRTKPGSPFDPRNPALRGGGSAQRCSRLLRFDATRDL